MKITFDWLKDHLKTNLKEKNLLEQLTNIGLEVESVESLSSDKISLIFLRFNFRDIISLNIPLKLVPPLVSK